MTATKTYEVLARAVRQEEPGPCFALLGDANMNWATALAGLSGRFVYVRHEHNAVVAAMAWARKTNRTGLATVTCGPGLTQILTALPAAVRAGIPLVIFAGEAPLKSGWYNQAIDQAPFIVATGAAYRPLHWPKRMPEEIRNAFLQAALERRPVVLGVPFDLQELPWEGSEDLPAPSSRLMPRTGPVLPFGADLERAAALVDGAEKIIVMAGLGAAQSGAADACRTLAERVGGLVATTLPARGLFAGDPFSLGVAGGFSSDMARACFAEADLVVAVGCSLASHNSEAGKLFPASKVLQIDLKPAALSQGRVAAGAWLQGDAGMSVELLTGLVRTRSRTWRSAELAERIRTTPFDGHAFPPEPGLHDPRDVVAALEAALPREWEMVNSSGHCSYYVAHMPSRPWERFLTIREFGAIGNGIGFAMGVAEAAGGRPVVLFDGDGSALMHIQEIETMARHGMRIAICVLNDGAYGSEIHKLRAEGLSDAGAVFGRRDFAAIARGFGLEGARVDDLSRLPALIDGFAKAKGPAIWDFPISDRVVSPVIRRAHPH